MGYFHHQILYKLQNYFQIAQLNNQAKPVPKCWLPYQLVYCSGCAAAKSQFSRDAVSHMYCRTGLPTNLPDWPQAQVFPSLFSFWICQHPTVSVYKVEELPFV